MPKTKQKKIKNNDSSYEIFSEAFPPNKDGKRAKLLAYSPTHELLKNLGDEILNKITPDKIIYKPLTATYIEEIKNLHKEWFPIEYDDEYFKKIFTNKYLSYFTIGAFYNLEMENNSKEIIIGMALCEYRPVSEYFIKHTSREAIKEINDNIDFNEEVSSYLKCQDYNCVYIMTIGVLDEFRKLNIGSNLVKKIIDIALLDNLCIGIYLDVIFYNNTAKIFYEKNGFKKITSIKNYYNIEGNFYEANVFLKVFTRKEKDEFRKKNYSLGKKLINYFIFMPINAMYKIIIFMLFCQCFKDKIKFD